VYSITYPSFPYHIKPFVSRYLKIVTIVAVLAIGTGVVTLPVPGLYGSAALADQGSD